MPLTKKQKEFYLEHEGHRCPFCKSAKIEASPVEEKFGKLDEEDQTYRVIKCLGCQKHWKELLGLVGVEDITNG